MKIKRLLAALLVVMVATAMAAPPCWACSCVPSTKKEDAKRADVIFTGKVLSVSDTSDDFTLKIRFRVGKVYKGQTKRRTYVFTTESGSLCGYTFKEDTKYTVFATWSDRQKWTSSCSGTKQGPINPDNYGLPEGYPPKDA